MLKTVAAFAAVLAAGAFVAPTVSQAAEVPSARVSYVDLNLASDLGQQSLQRRIFRAAESVCEVGLTRREVKFTLLATGCRDGAIADAQPQFEAAVNAARRGTVTVGAAAALIVTAP
jgi:UrcA family protein